MDGSWADQPGALIHTDAEDEAEDGNLASIPSRKPAPRAKGKAPAATRKPAAPAKKVPPTRTARGKRKAFEDEEDDEEEDEDVIMIEDDDEEEEDEESLFVKPAASRTTTRKPAARKPAAKAPARTASPKKTTARATKQSTLNFSQSSTPRGQPPASTTRGRKLLEPVRSINRQTRNLH